MIAELEQIIQTEEAKPEAERDADLIDECIREIAELKGVKAEYSDEEIDRITDKLVKAAEEKRKRKRFTRHIAGIAAALVIVSGVTACAVNPELINWFVKVVRMPFGSSAEHNFITYINQGTEERFSSIEELLKSKDYDIYYPTVLPEGIKIRYVEVLEADGIILICFRLTSDELRYTVQPNYSNPVSERDIISHIEAPPLSFSVCFEDNKYICRAQNEDDTYILQADNMDDIIVFVGGLRKVSR